MAENKEVCWSRLCFAWWFFLLGMIVFLVGIGMTLDDSFYEPLETASEETVNLVDDYTRTSFGLMTGGGAVGVISMGFAYQLGSSSNWFLKYGPIGILLVIVFMIVCGYVGAGQALQQNFSPDNDHLINNWQYLAVGVSGGTTFLAIITCISIGCRPPKQRPTEYSVLVNTDVDGTVQKFSHADLQSCGLTDEEKRKLLGILGTDKGGRAPPLESKPKSQQGLQSSSGGSNVGGSSRSRNAVTKQKLRNLTRPSSTAAPAAQLRKFRKKEDLKERIPKTERKTPEQLRREKMRRRRVPGPQPPPPAPNSEKVQAVQQLATVTDLIRILLLRAGELEAEISAGAR